VTEHPAFRNAVRATGEADRLEAFAERCMSEYDVDGWTRPDIVGGDDLEVVRRQTG
jgi:4-hydroxyphenylacetate 3-monooxygenase